MQNKTSVFDKKSSNTIWYKNSDMVEKERWWREEPITADPKEDNLWGLKEDPITEDPKENPINEKAKEDPLSLWNLKTMLSVKILRSFRTLNDFYAGN